MSFIGKAITGIGQALGLVSNSSAAPAPLTPATTAPTVANSSTQLDDAALAQAKSMQGGRTSTMLTGGAGETEDQKYTSKVLLGQ